MLKKHNNVYEDTEESTNLFYDLIIIGGGIVGSLLSLRLSKYDLSICLLEKEADLAMEETSANSAIIHAGFDPVPGSMKARLNVAGNRMMESLCEELGVSFIRNGSLVLAFTQSEYDILGDLMKQGETNGVQGLVLLSKDEVLHMEPNLAPEVLGALHAPSGGIVSPYELTLAASEVAHQNGVDYYFEHEVTRIQVIPEKGFEVSCNVLTGVQPAHLLQSEETLLSLNPFRQNPLDATDCNSNNLYSSQTGVKSFKQTISDSVKSCSPKNSFKPVATSRKTISCRFIINAAGVYSDHISNMAGDYSFSIIPQRGEYVVMDKTMDKRVSHTIFQTPSSKGKGVLVTPTVDGNILVGPNSHVVENPSDTRTTAQGIDEIWKMALKSVPTLDKKWMIRSFAGIRSTSSTHDFIIGESSFVKGFFHAAGIESPGLTSAPAIAQELEETIMKTLPGVLVLKKSIQTKRKPVIRFRDLSQEEKEQKIKENPLYAKIVCRCEHITEAEIRDAIRRPLGATTVNGVKLRTRAGMGRCQSGFCLPRILSLLAEERNITEESVTLFGTGSEVIMGRIRNAEGDMDEPET